MDAIWVKSPQYILERSKRDEVVKFALFCLANNAQDLGMKVLIDFTKAHGPILDQSGVPDPILVMLEKQVASLLFSLRDRPRYDGVYLAATFKAIFNKNWVKPGEFFRRYPIS